MIIIIVFHHCLYTNLLGCKRYPLSWSMEHVEKWKALSKLVEFSSVGFDAIMYWSSVGQVPPSGLWPSCFTIPRLKYYLINFIIRNISRGGSRIARRRAPTYKFDRFSKNCMELRQFWSVRGP